MSYIFPKRVLRSKDILDPAEMNEDYVPASELYSGKLNAHNFRDDVAVPRAENALFNYAHSWTTVNHKMGSPGAFSLPNTSSTSDDVLIPNTQVWKSIESSSVTTGNSTLWITACLQYFWLWWSSYSDHPGLGWKRIEFADGTGDEGEDGAYAGEGRPAAVQFAIRVDGRVIEWTITGKQNPFEAPAAGLKPTNAKVAAVFHPEYVRRTTACGPEMLPVRMTTAFPVAAGTHTIEIVARRIPRPTASYTNQSDHVYVFSRQLFVLDMPSHPQASTTPSTLEVVAQETESTLSAASLGTDAIDKTRDAFNDIKTGAVARGAFTRDHIASPVTYSSAMSFDEAPIATNKSYNHYPGFGGSIGYIGTEDVTTVPYDDSEWLNLYHNTSAGIEHLRTTDACATTSGTLNTTDKTLILIYANIDVTRLMYYFTGYDARPSSTGNRVRDVVACFKLGYYDSTDDEYYMIQPSEANVNKTTWWMRDLTNGSTTTRGSGGLMQGPDNEPMNIDVPLFGILECSEGGSSTTIDAADIGWIGVFVSVLQMGNSSAQSDNELWVQWVRASLQVFQLKV
jgi:hypothetical protein